MRRWLLRIVPLVAVLALAGWVRISNYPAVLVRGELLPQLDGDSAYHLRRTLETLAHFPDVPRFDPEMNWPHGGICPWADGFDLGAATWALALGARSDPRRAPLAIALFPVFLGLLVVWAAMRLAWSVAPGRGGWGGALAAGVVAALVPDSMFQSQLGRTDHHVFEALVMTLLGTWALRRIPVRRGVEVGSSTLRFEIEGAILCTLAVYGFTGSVLYVCIVLVPLAWASMRDGRIVGAGAPGLAIAAILVGLANWPAVREHGRPFAFQTPSFLHAVLLALGAFALAGVGWCGRAGVKRWRRSAIAAAALAVVVALLAFATPTGHEVRSGVLGWMLHRDPWLANVQEFKPLFDDEHFGRSWLGIYWLLGWTGFFFPVAATILGARSARKSPRSLQLVWIAVALTGLTLLQNRFDRVLIPIAAAIVGIVISLVFRLLALRLRWMRFPMLAPGLALALFVFDPPSHGWFSLRRAGGFEPSVEAALDLRDRPLDASSDPGVFTNWSYGHQVHVLSGHPVVVNGFGSYLDEGEFWRAAAIMRGEPEAFDRYLAEHKIGAVLAGAATIGNEVLGAHDSQSFDQRRLNEAYMKSVPLSVLMIGGSAIPGWDVKHLEHLMPRFASRGVAVGLSFPLPFLWSFERVAGAIIRGRAPAGARVVAELPFREHRRPHTYKAWTDARADGSWEITLPFPSGLLRPTIQSDAQWRVSVKHGPLLHFSVPEEAVRGGAVLDVGSVAGPTGAAGVAMRRP